MIDGVVSSTPTIGRVNPDGVSRNVHGREGMLRKLAPHTFVAGAENRLAAMAYAAVLAEPKPRGKPIAYNPLILFGPTGCGKTLLVRELADSWRQLHTSSTVVYKPAVEFAQEFQEAVERQDVEQFRRKHREAGLLIIEDITRMAGRETAQYELRATVDALIGNNRRLIVTASLAPGQWPACMYDLQARLTAGLTIPLVYPEQESRRTIIARLAADAHSELTEEAARQLASVCPGPVANLAGAVHQLTFAATSTNRQHKKIGLEDIQQYLTRHHTVREPALSAIATETARLFSLKVVQLRGRSRSRTVTTARGVAMYVARRLTHNSLQQIGQYFGGRDHTTVLHGCRKIEALLGREPDVQKTVTQVQNKFLEVATQKE